MDYSWDSLDPCNAKLLNAVRAKNIDKVQRQLEDIDINVDYDIGYGNTVLFESLQAGSFGIFECLLNYGFDMRRRNHREETPLHIAAIYSDSSFVHALIRRGADVNAKENRGLTPLSYAAQHGNSDTVCTLLYYDADVNAVCKENMNPFMWALENDSHEVASILLDFYDDFSCKTVKGETALNLATTSESSLCRAIFKKSPNVKNQDLGNVLFSSIENDNAELFKLIWHRRKEEIYLDVDHVRYGHCLLMSLLHCDFSNSDFLNCLHLLFTSPSIFENLLRYGRGWTGEELSNQSFLEDLIICLYERKIDLHQRLVLINLSLSFGRNVSTHDINVAYLLYGFNEEVETFIHTLNYQQTIIPEDFLPLPRFIFVLEDNYKIDSISPIFEFWEKNKRGLGDIALKQDVIVKSLGYITLSPLQKQIIKNVCMDYFEDHERIIQKLDSIPDVPSLLELSRNQIRQQYSGAKSYQLHNTINKLNLPPYIKDVIRFKAPVY